MRGAALLLALLLVSDTVFGQASGTRVYVRRIDIVGTATIDDGTLRRRLLQLEGTYLNTGALEASRLRLEQLPYVASAEARLEPVPGTADHVVVVITITEAPARRYQLGGGYSESQQGSFQGFFVNENLFGLGHRFAAEVEASEIRRSADISYTDPFAHGDAVSRTLALQFRDVDQLTVDTSDLRADLLAGRVQYAYPISATASVSAGLALQRTELAAGSEVSEQLTDWISQNGDVRTSAALPATSFVGADVLFAWQTDTRAPAERPRRGAEHRLSVRLALPGSEVEYASVDYRFSQYWPLPRSWTGKLAARAGYGAAYGSTTSLPPNLHWLAGGQRTVRGYEENRLGPQDSLGNPYGGNLFLNAQLELVAPLPKPWSERLRLALFYDVGNVFATEGVRFADASGSRLDFGFEWSELRHSLGLALDVRLPIGTLGLSYGVPLNADDDNPNPFLRDRVRRFQVTMGLGF